MGFSLRWLLLLQSAGFRMCELQWVKVAHSYLTLCDPMDYTWNSPGQNTGVGSLSFLQGIFPSQGSNPGLLHCRRILSQLSHKGISSWGLSALEHGFSSRGFLTCLSQFETLSYKLLFWLSMKVKEESEKVGLKLNIQQTKIMASDPII